MGFNSIMVMQKKRLQSPRFNTTQVRTKRCSVRKKKRKEEEKEEEEKNKEGEPQK